VIVLEKNQDGKKLTTILFVYWQQKKCLLDGKTVSVPNKTYGGAISQTNKLAL
jgi:hypothetical protein